LPITNPLNTVIEITRRKSQEVTDECKKISEQLQSAIQVRQEAARRLENFNDLSRQRNRAQEVVRRDQNIIECCKEWLRRKIAIIFSRKFLYRLTSIFRFVQKFRAVKRFRDQFETYCVKLAEAREREDSRDRSGAKNRLRQRYIELTQYDIGNDDIFSNRIEFMAKLHRDRLRGYKIDAEKKVENLTERLRAGSILSEALLGLKIDVCAEQLKTLHGLDVEPNLVDGFTQRASTLADHIVIDNVDAVKAFQEKIDLLSRDIENIIQLNNSYKQLLSRCIDLNRRIQDAYAKVESASDEISQEWQVLNKKMEAILENINKQIKNPSEAARIGYLSQIHQLEEDIRNFEIAQQQQANKRTEVLEASEASKLPQPLPEEELTVGVQADSSGQQFSEDKPVEEQGSTVTIGTLCESTFFQRLRNLTTKFLKRRIFSEEQLRYAAEEIIKLQKTREICIQRIKPQKTMSRDTVATVDIEYTAWAKSNAHMCIAETFIGLQEVGVISEAGEFVSQGTIELKLQPKGTVTSEKLQEWSGAISGGLSICREAEKQKQASHDGLEFRI